MATQPQNVAVFEAVNGWLHSIGPDGRYNRDRIFASLGIPPGPDGDYGQRFGLNDQQRKDVQAVIERELSLPFPKGIEIDPAGNMNEDEGFAVQLRRWGPVVLAGVLAAIGARQMGMSSAAAATTGVVSAAGGAFQLQQIDRQREAQAAAELERYRQQQAAALAAQQSGGGLFGGLDPTTMIMIGAVLVVAVLARR
jgi:hypothetical protein